MGASAGWRLSECGSPIMALSSQGASLSSIQSARSTETSRSMSHQRGGVAMTDASTSAMLGYWAPTGVRRLSTRPAVGDVVAFAMAAWEVVWVRDDDPTPEQLAVLDRFPEAARSRYAPYSMTLRRLHGPKHDSENSRQEIGFGLNREPGRSAYGLRVYHHGRVPLCSCCGHPWPCSVSIDDERAALAAEQLDRRLERSLPGVCYACGEPITARMQSQRVGVQHAEIPGYPAPVFHAGRWRCRAAMERYRAKHGIGGGAAPKLDLSSTEGDQP